MLREREIRTRKRRQNGAIVGNSGGEVDPYLSLPSLLSSPSLRSLLEHFFSLVQPAISATFAPTFTLILQTLGRHRL